MRRHGDGRFEGQKNGRFAELTSDLYESKEFTGKPLDLALLHRPAGLKARRLLLIGGASPRRSLSRRCVKQPGRRCAT